MSCTVQQLHRLVRLVRLACKKKEKKSVRFVSSSQKKISKMAKKTDGEEGPHTVHHSLTHSHSGHNIVYCIPLLVHSPQLTSITLSLP
jgi:hypothetical protein